MEPHGRKGSWVRWRSRSGRRGTLLTYTEHAHGNSLLSSFEKLRNDLYTLLPELREAALQADAAGRPLESVSPLPGNSLSETFATFKAGLLNVLSIASANGTNFATPFDEATK